MSIRDEVYKAVRCALKDDPLLREVAAEEVAHQLVLEGYLHEEPPGWLIADALGTVAAEEQAFAPGICPADV